MWRRTLLFGASLCIVAYLSYGYTEVGPAADAVQRQCRPTGGRADPSTRSRPSTDPARFVIQYTDTGALVDRCALTDALQELETDSAKVVLLYVHGWKHSGDSEDGDLKEFDALLAKARTSLDSSGDKRQVIGLFVAWNGKSWSLPVLREFTFWGRKKAADTVSQSAAVTRLIGAVRHIRETAKLERERAGVRAEALTVFVGHSFGARLLFTAVSQVLIYELQQVHPGNAGSTYRKLNGPSTLTVLLNPAFEASLYAAFDAERRVQEQFDSNQHPVLLTVSTRNDWATKYAYPMGQWVGLDRAPMKRLTVGNYQPFITHSLSRRKMEPEAHLRVAWYDEYCCAGLCLAREPGDPQPGNPFLVASTDRSVLDGHNGIWSLTFVEWLWAFARAVENGRSEGTGPSVPTVPTATKPLSQELPWRTVGEKSFTATVFPGPAQEVTIEVDHDGQRLSDVSQTYSNNCGWARIGPTRIVNRGRKAVVKVEQFSGNSPCVITLRGDLQERSPAAK